MSGAPGRLTERERRVLRLLAGGHTAKSAAAAESISEYAANELLRSARRKLGLGSSREAARWLTGQESGAPESRDEKIVVPAPVSTADILASLDKETLAMIAAAVAASAHAPKVVSTEPADGAEIEPGPFTLSVTFDRAMAPRSYSFCHNAAEGAFPPASGQPRLSADRCTYSLECTAEPGAHYVVRFNQPPYNAFRDAVAGIPAQPARLEFTVR